MVCFARRQPSANSSYARAAGIVQGLFGAQVSTAMIAALMTVGGNVIGMLSKVSSSARPKKPDENSA
jgi:Flp pilus assembly pilin Flp